MNIKQTNMNTHNFLTNEYEYNLKILNEHTTKKCDFATDLQRNGRGCKFVANTVSKPSQFHCNNCNGHVRCKNPLQKPVFLVV